MFLEKYEKETIIVFNEEEKTANVYTFNKKLIKKLDMLCNNNEAELVKYSNEGSKTYNVPKSWIKISPPKRMNISEERRKALIETAKSNFNSG